MQKEVHRALVVRAMRVGCTVTAILSRRKSNHRPAILAPRPRCGRGAFYTLSSSGVFFTCICRVVSPGLMRCHLTALVLKIKKTTPCAPRRSAGHRSSARCACDRSCGWNDADFLLFCVTSDQIRWLQSGVVVPRVTPPLPGRGRHLRQWGVTRTSFARPLSRRPGSGACAHVVPWTSVGHPPSLGLLLRKGERFPPAAPPALACSSGLPRSAESSPLLLHRKSTGGS